MSHIEIWTDQSPVPYEVALTRMEARVTDILTGQAPDTLWFLTHPPLYTIGRSGQAADVLRPRFPVHQTGRGGQITYHGPGQLIVYVMADLRRPRPHLPVRDVRAFVRLLEESVIRSLADLGLIGHRRAGRVGIWIERPDKPPGEDGAVAEDKIAAIGVRLRHWVSFHGLSVNSDPDLSAFADIIPCGLRQAHWGVTSLADLQRPTGLPQLQALLRHHLSDLLKVEGDGI